jgi:hypothetical protein
VLDVQINVGVHMRPEIPEPDLVEGMIQVEMAANGVGVKSCEDDIPELSWNDL